MNAEGIKEIERLTKEASGKIVEIDGREYSTVALHDPRKKLPEPAVLTVHTLAGLVDYVREQATSDVPEDGTLIHIAGPARVDLIGTLQGEFNQRFTYVSAQLLERLGGFQFGQFYPAEEFNIALQTRFVDNDGRKYVLGLVGNIKSDAAVQVRNDGVTQRVETRAGISLADTTDVKNPVLLAPFRTFPELEQPASEFVLRVRGGSNGSAPTAALFEADGGKWRLEAIARIREYLTAKLPDVVVIG